MREFSHSTHVELFYRLSDPRIISMLCSFDSHELCWTNVMRALTIVYVFNGCTRVGQFVWPRANTRHLIQFTSCTLFIFNLYGTTVHNPLEWEKGLGAFCSNTVSLLARSSVCTSVARVTACRAEWILMKSSVLEGARAGPRPTTPGWIYPTNSPSALSNLNTCISESRRIKWRRDDVDGRRRCRRRRWRRRRFSASTSSPGRDWARSIKQYGI